MTRVLRYTDSGGNVGSVDGGAAFTFGTAVARQTTRTAIYDNIIVPALTAAGWTQHNLAARDDVWTSTGESGLESINIRTRYDTTGGTFIYFYIGTKVDGAFNLQGSIGGGVGVFERWSLGNTDFTTDYIVMATKDFIWFNVRAATAGQGGVIATNDQLNAFMGNLERDASYNSNVLTTTGTATAGSNVTISVNSDPIAAGYRPGDLIQIVAQAAADAGQAQTLQIINVSTTPAQIEVETLSATYASGAFIGAAPTPIARFVGLNTDPNTAANWYMPFLSSVPSGTTDLASAPGQALGAVDFAAGQNSSTAQDGFGTATTANKRTRRFSIRSLELRATSDMVVGRVPGIYVYPGSMSFYPNDIGLFNRVTPNQNFLGARFVNAGTSNWMFGKSP